MQTDLAFASSIIQWSSHLSSLFYLEMKLNDFVLTYYKLATTQNFTSSILMFFQWEDKDGKLSGMIIYLKLTCVGQKESKEKCYLLKALGNVTCKSNVTFFKFNIYIFLPLDCFLVMYSEILLISWFLNYRLVHTFKTICVCNHTVID